MPDLFDEVSAAPKTDIFDEVGQPSELSQEEVGKALDVGVPASTALIGPLTRTLTAGAEGADIGRRQAQKERLSEQLRRARVEGDIGKQQESAIGGLEKSAEFISQMDPLNVLKRTMDIPAQLGGTPYRVGPTISPELARKAVDFLDPLPDKPGSVREGVKQFAAETLSSVSSPDQSAALLAGKAHPELVARLFQTQMASGIPNAAQALSQAIKSGDSTEVGKAAAALGSSVALPALIEKGIRTKEKPYAPNKLREPVSLPSERAGDDALRTPAETGVGGGLQPATQGTPEAAGQAQAPNVTQTTSPVPAPEIPTGPTATGLRPAIRLVGGKVVPGEAGEVHADIIKANDLKATDIDQRGFIGPNGEFIDREQGAQAAGVPLTTEPGRLHSTDLPESKGAPAGQAGVPPPTAPATVEAKAGEVAPSPAGPAIPEPSPAKPVGQERIVTERVTEPPATSVETPEISQGTVGMMLRSGEVVKTSSGRTTTPFPKTQLKASNAIKRVNEWLMQNALDEAEARGDEFNARSFRSDLKNPPQASKDAAEEYLFGTQPEVPKPILKTVQPSTQPAAAKVEPGARGPWLGRMLDDSFGEQQKGYPKAKEVLKGWSDEDLSKERSEMAKASLNPMFGMNAKKVLNLIESEIKARKEPAAKVEREVQKVATTQGQRPAKEVKAELVSRLEDEVKSAPSERDLADLGEGKREPTEGEMLAKRTEQPKVTIEIPGDGTFTVYKTKEALQSILDRAKAIKTSPNLPPKIKRTGISAEDKDFVEQQLAKPGTVTTQEPIGMGGAVGSEFEPSGGTYTSTKNAVVDQERIKRGLPPALQPARREFGQVWDQAMAKIDQNPDYPGNLIKELERKPRAATDEENAVLLHRQVDLQNEYAKATRDLAQAFQDGRTEAVDTETIRVGNLLDQLKRLYDVEKKTGTETGRGLNARKMLANEDFTLAKMTLDFSAAKGGARLTPEQTLEVQRLHDKIAETQKAYDEYVSRSQVKIGELEQQLKEVPRFTPPIIKAAERIVATLDTRADAARARLREKMGRMSAGVDPTIITDLAEIGAAHIAHIGLDFAKWSAEMIKEVGEWARPHLDDVYKASQKAIDDFGGVPEAAKKAVKSAFSRLNDAGKEAATVDAVKEKVAQSKPDQISWYVNRLARDLVGRGVKDREKLIDIVHSVLQKAIPDITRRESMDAISGSGKFKQLPKDDISVTLRGMKGEMQQLAKLEDMAAGKPPLKTGIERRTPTDAERELIKRVNDAKFKFQIPVEDPNTQLKSALDTLKTTLTNRIKDYEDRIARGDYSTRPRRELVLDAEASRLKAENERAKKEFQKGVELERFKNSQALERGAHWVNKWRRGFILSGPVTLAKLTAAGVQRAIFTPMEEAVGAGIGQVFPELAKRAPREGRFSGAAEKAAAKGLINGIADARDIIGKGESDTDVLYGRTSALPGSWLDFFGRVHAALKAPAKRAEFERSFTKRIESYAANNPTADISNPWIQMKTGIEAYKDANRAIFLQDNRLVSGYKRMIGAWEQKNKITGEVPVGGKIAATTARVLLPIVKVPTNLVAETLQTAFGSLSGSARLAYAYAKGIENLPPEHADLIMRELKKGSIGAAVLLLGYFNPNAIGGYYQPGEKRKPGEPKVGSIKVYGHNIPSFLLHNPLLETLQIGATIRRVADAQRSKSDPTQKGVGEGLYAAALGLGTEIPFVRETMEVTKAFNLREKGAFWGELGKSLLVPQAIQWVAQRDDLNAKGEVRKRAPKTVLQHIETGIPVLRHNVPLAKNQP